MKRTVPAFLLVATLASPTAALTPGCPPINLREYWILADIVNPNTGERVSFRVDCTDGEPFRCREYRDRPESKSKNTARDLFATKNERSEPRKRRGFHEEEFILAEVDPILPGIVSYAAAGAGGYSHHGRNVFGQWKTKSAPLSELRQPRGFSIRISTVRDGERVEYSDIRLTMWLVTPAELEMRSRTKSRKPVSSGAVTDTPRQR